MKTIPVNGQVDCATPSTVLYISNQTAADNFAATYSGCTNFLGSINIRYSVTNVDSLINLTSVGGELYINNSNVLSNIEGLSNITNIGGSLHITSLDLLENADDLSSLTYIGTNLKISNNAALSNIDGLNGISHIGEDIDIVGNDLLENVNGLNDFSSIGGNLYIYDNEKLEYINGFNSLQTANSLSISTNGLLGSIDGFSSLSSLSSNLGITSNDFLPNTNGLHNLTSIGGYCNISFNDELIDLYGLSGLTSIGGYLNIKHNDLLGNIGVSAYCGLYTLLSTPSGLSGDYDIDNNAFDPLESDIINFGPCPIPPSYSIGGDSFITLNDAIAAGGSPINVVATVKETTPINLPHGVILNVEAPYILSFDGSASMFSNYGTINNNSSVFFLNGASLINFGSIFNNGVMRL